MTVQEPGRPLSNTAKPRTALYKMRHRHIYVVCGPAGCGKTTVAQYLAKTYRLHYLEGDDYHPKSNIEKMASGTPLNDGDRWDWLVSLRDAATAAALKQHAQYNGVVMACSALKHKYRDVFRIASYNDDRIKVHFLFLSASRDVLFSRVQGREAHFMKANMIDSQLRDLELPSENELDIDVSIDVASSLDTVRRLASRSVAKICAGDAIAGNASWP